MIEHTDYMVVTGLTVNDLVKGVKIMIDDGWFVTGGIQEVSEGSHKFVQSLVKQKQSPF